MTYNSLNAIIGVETLYSALFEALPGNSVLLKTNAPHFTILAVTPAYVEQSGYTREYLVGKGIFEAFPANSDPTDTGESVMQTSLHAVVETKEPQYLPVQRYDLQNRDGSFTLKYWKASNKPVFSPGGEVAYIIHTAEDITDQVQADKLKERIKGIEQAQNIFLQAPVAMAILCGPTHIVEIANDRMYELWGKSKEELLGKSIFDGLPEVRDQGYEEMLNRAFITGERFTAFGIPVTLPRNNTIETTYINLLYEAYREGDGIISGIIAVATDVTEQITAQKRLEENEVILQQRVAERTADLEKQKGLIANILEASMDGIYALKAVRNSEGVVTDFQYLFANNNTAKLLSLSVQDIIGASMLTLIPENRSNGFFDLFCKLLEAGETFHDETHFVTQSIDSWYRYVIVPLDKDTLVVSTEDITEKKQASLQIEEQRNLLDSILKNSSNGISVSRIFRDDQGNVVDALTILANDSAVKYIGLPKEVYLTRRATEIEPNIIGSPYYQHCVHTLQTGEPFMMQYLMESTNRWLELTVSRLDKDHLIQVFSDVTPIKQAQLQLERSLEDLKRSNKNLEQFANAASHDLKEPIRKIRFFLERLKDSLGDRTQESEKKYFDRIESASLRMKTLIDDLLSYSLASQKITVEERVDMNELMNQVLTDLDLEIEQKRATINIPELFTITGHRRQLQQAFQNLIGNALKYNKPGTPPVITISCSKIQGADAGIQLPVEDQAKNYYQVTVTDNGIGFEQEDAERIFNVFTRLHGMAEYKGTGVGLSIVRRVIENHNGYIWAESQPDEGATFKILLSID